MADLPVRALHDEAHRQLVRWNRDRSSFAAERSSAVEKIEARHCRDGWVQRTGVIPAPSNRATMLAPASQPLTACAVCMRAGCCSIAARRTSWTRP